ncbi:MAG: PBP1A family penicillin-binding protein [Eubacteriales bacterium]
MGLYFMKSGAIMGLKITFFNISDSLKELFSRLFKSKKNPPEGTNNIDTDTDLNETSVFSGGGNNFKKAARKSRGFFKSIISRYEVYFTPPEKEKNFALSVTINTIRILFVLLIITGFCAFGSVLGLAKGYMETTPTLDVADIQDQAVNSYIYDQGGTLVTTFSGLENRDWASLSEIPEKLQEAYIAIEDIRFEYHSGIDVKRILGSFVNNFTSSSTQGGSTITQQLIKNSILSSEQTYKRKIQEAYLAIQLESVYSKDQILEAYLNTIPLGGTIYGIKAAATDYFGKDLDELSLREMACLAAMAQAPTKYNPRRVYYVTQDPTALNERIDTVLKNMYTANYITKEEYEAALRDELNVVEESTYNTSSVYPYAYFIDYMINDVIDNMLIAQNLEDTEANRSKIETELRTGGYKIYTTLDTEMQDTVQETLSTYNYPAMADSENSVKLETDSSGTTIETVQPQSSAVVFDYHTGEIKAIIGGRDEPTYLKALNRAYQSNMPVGSAIKPISVYGPAIDIGYSPASIVANVPVAIPGWNTATGYPATNKSTYGPVTFRTAIVHSLNAATARILMEDVGINTSTNYLESLGVDPDNIISDGPGLALGTSGITTLEMAVAYGCIANGGLYMQPLTFTKVVDRDGNVILDADSIRVTRQVFKKTTAYLLTDMLEDAVSEGTGTRAKIAGMTVAGKTGTNQDNRGVSFSGYTPYYSASVYIGHDDYEPLSSRISASSTAAPLWQSFMSKLHEGLTNKEIIDFSEVSDQIVTATVCSVSGKLATDACYEDILGRTPVTDIFDKDSVPTEECDWHYEFNFCTDSGLIATPFCPDEKLVKKALVFADSTSALSLWPGTNGSIVLPDSVYSDTFDISQFTYDNSLYSSLFCDVHTAATSLKTAKTAARSAITNANNKLNANPHTVEQYDEIMGIINQLNTLLSSSTATEAEITSLTNLLNSTVKSYFP